MKRTFLCVIFTVLITLFYSCEETINRPEAVGQFVFDGIEYGVDIQELKNKGINILTSSDTERECLLCGEYYGIELVDMKKNYRNHLTLDLKNSKVVGVFMTVMQSGEELKVDSPLILKAASQLMYDINENLKQFPSESYAPDIVFPSLNKEFTWEKNGLKYVLTMRPWGDLDCFEIQYYVGEIKKE